MDDKVKLIVDETQVNIYHILRDTLWPWSVAAGKFIGLYLLWLPVVYLAKLIWLGLGFLVWPFYLLFSFFVVRPVMFAYDVCYALYPVAIFLVGAMATGLIIGACAGFTFEAIATMSYNLTWGAFLKPEDEPKADTGMSIDNDAHYLMHASSSSSSISTSSDELEDAWLQSTLHLDETMDDAIGGAGADDHDNDHDDYRVEHDDDDIYDENQRKRKGKQPARSASPHLRRRTNVMMTTVVDREHTTILDLKQQLTARTHIPTAIQCIKSLCGRPLDDSDLVFMDKEPGPVIYNVKVVAARAAVACCSHPVSCSCHHYTAVKKSRSDSTSPSITTLTLNATMWFNPLHDKGKAKDTRKRKVPD
ncbi:hypothetical protein BC940DRAFT_367977 [Gongronella butleri]|nr:hypothetical protein BC940DRAFT_367977 [Gongronella butleri]